MSTLEGFLQATNFSERHVAYNRRAAVILELIDESRRERGMSTVFVTHDLALAFEFCDEIVVMQRGRVVERGSSAELLRAPKHAYTRALMAATPSVSSNLEALRRTLEVESHD